MYRFRTDMAAAGLGEPLFEAAGRSLDARGLFVRQGTLIDASLMAAAVAEPRRQPGGGRSKADPEACWAKKGTKATFGYKLRIGVEQGSGLVRAARLTAAAVADCNVGPDPAGRRGRGICRHRIRQRHHARARGVGGHHQRRHAPAEPASSSVGGGQGPQRCHWG